VRDAASVCILDFDESGSVDSGYRGRAHTKRAAVADGLEKIWRRAIIPNYRSGGAVRNQRAFAAALCAVPAVAVGKEQIDICAEYTATGKTFHVAAISTNGSELNEETDTLNHNSLSHYIVFLGAGSSFRYRNEWSVFWPRIRPERWY
jgi:hypothetical protein